MRKKNFGHYFKIFFRSTAFIINLAVIAWLALCLLASYKDVAAHPSVLSLFSFTGVFAVGANCFFVFFWLFSSKKLFSLFSLVGLCLCYSVTQVVFGHNLFSGNTINNEDVELKVMTWNVHLFDLGEWTKNKASKNKIIDFIKEQDPDILCLEEYYHDSANANEPYKESLQQLGYTYYVFSKEEDIYKRSINISARKSEMINCGHAVFSKFPLSNKMRYTLDAGGKNNMLSVDVKLGDETSFTLNVMHLQSVLFSDKEVQYADMKSERLSPKLEPKTKGLLKKLMKASSKRAGQANVIDSVLRQAALPNMVCGDFNDVPASYVYSRIKGNLKDAFVSRGFGFGRTYRKILGTLRIDYIFYDQNLLECKGYLTPDVNLSDHNPVIATFIIKKDNAQTKDKASS